MRIIDNPARLRLGGVFFCLWLALSVTGCATPPQTHRLQQSEPTLPRTIELEATPFFSQQRYQCGPAALATVLVHAGVDTSADALVEQVYLPGRRGSLQAELTGATRRHGRVPYPLAASLANLLQEVAAGNPVLVLQNLGLPSLPGWHYAVVVGYDLDTGVVLLRSGTHPRRVTQLGKFERTWQRADHWALVVSRPDVLPASAEVHTWLTAVAEFERMQDYTRAARAYTAALQRWPDSDIAALGLANSLYAQRQLDGASQVLLTALQHHPDNAVLHNNLAQVLSERGELASALRHAQRAVDIGGAHAAQFSQTLAEIEARINKAGHGSR